jgi:pyrroline-5-carboxylate reductase
MKKLGFIGVGNMGGAIIKGCLAAGGSTDRIAAFDKDGEKLAALAQETGLGVQPDIGALAAVSEIVVLAVKPNNFDEVLPRLAPVLGAGQIVVSMAAGVSIRFIEGFLGDSRKIIRIMPNTPAMVGASMTAVSGNAQTTAAEMADVLEIFRAIGRAEVVDESMMDVVTGGDR